jgi:alpha-tubulin suppressor-like RCC1 family protein
MGRALALIALLQFYEVTPSCVCGSSDTVSIQPGTDIAMGRAHGCSLASGTVTCFGENLSGELGRGTQSAAESRPAPVALSESVAQISLGDGTSCALTVSGAVWCWGKNDVGQLAQAGVTTSATPMRVGLPTAAKFLSVGEDFALALSSDGRLFAWGNDREGPFGRGGVNEPTAQIRDISRAAPALRFTSVSGGGANACGIDDSRTLWCWGRNSQGQLGLSSSTGQYRTPQKILSGVDSVNNSSFLTCAIRSGELWCFGDAGPELKYATPAKVDIGKSVRSVSTRFLHACAVDTDDGVWCWGRGTEGQLGLGSIQSIAQPQRSAQAAASLSVGNFSTCALTTDRPSPRVTCTGKNESGELGDGTLQRRSDFGPQ